MINNIIIQGRLTRPPEVKHFNKKDGTPTSVMGFTIANETGYGDFKKTSFFDCKRFGNVEKISSLMFKGQMVIVSGVSVQERWEKDGQKFSKFVIQVNDLQLLEWKDRTDTQEPTQTYDVPETYDVPNNEINEDDIF